ncbi:MAG TPA: GspH/FimT family pseudopilin [Candidatus Deferrimicrobiaceae bacterium]
MNRAIKSPRLPDKEGGFSMVEILITLAIAGILLLAVGYSFQGWLAKHKVTGETGQMFADIIDARAKAMQRGRATFVVLRANGYSTYEDTDPAPDGDLALNEGPDRLIVAHTLTYPVEWNLAGGNVVRFDRNGFASIPNGTIHLHTTMTPDVDCIAIGTTRVKLGRYVDATDTCILQ